MKSHGFMAATSINQLGKVNVPAALEMVTYESSTGCIHSF